MPEPRPATPDAAPEADAGPRRDRSWIRRRYGASGWHLVGLLACFVVAGYAALRWLDEPTATRLVVWFVGALLLHDVVLFPLYSLLDRLLDRLLRRTGPPSGRSHRVPVVNHIRVPALFSGLLLLLWFPLLFSKSEPAYESATGLDTAPFLGRWLLVTAVLFGASGLIYVARRLARRSGSSPPSPRSGAEANSRMPSAKATDADQPNS
jgi:hypothetical protein